MYVGLNGQTCNVIIVDPFSGTLCGETFVSKAPPVEFLNCFLAVKGLL
jgi:hypothetical protein